MAGCGGELLALLTILLRVRLAHGVSSKLCLKPAGLSLCAVLVSGLAVHGIGQSISWLSLAVLGLIGLSSFLAGLILLPEFQHQTVRIVQSAVALGIRRMPWKEAQKS